MREFSQQYLCKPITGDEILLELGDKLHKDERLRREELLTMWNLFERKINDITKERDHYKEKFEAEKKRTDNLFDKLETKFTQSNPCVNLNC